MMMRIWVWNAELLIHHIVQCKGKKRMRDDKAMRRTMRDVQKSSVELRGRCGGIYRVRKVVGEGEGGKVGRECPSRTFSC
jgi:hypothetical protein